MLSSLEDAPVETIAKLVTKLIQQIMEMVMHFLIYEKNATTPQAQTVLQNEMT